MDIFVNDPEDLTNKIWIRGYRGVTKGLKRGYREVKKGLQRGLKGVAKGLKRGYSEV